MSAAFIGCKISLISKSEIRYEGILYTIDTKDSTIALAKVKSYGTEDRITDKPMAPRSEIYEYIIFRASDIKDLIVDDPPAASAPGLSDPAIIQAQSSGGAAQNFPPSFAEAASNAKSTGHAGSSGGTKTVSGGLTFSNVSGSVSSGPPAGGPAFGSSQGYRSGGSTPTPSSGHRKSPGGDGHQGSQDHKGDRSGSMNALGREGRPHQQQMQMHQHQHQQQQQQNRATGDRRSYQPQSQQRRPAQQYQGYVQYSQQRPQQQQIQGGYRMQPRPPPGQSQGYQPQRRGPMNPRTPPQPLFRRDNRGNKPNPIKIEGEYDFEKANQEFEDLEKKFEQLKVDTENKMKEEEKASEELQTAPDDAQDEDKKEDDENFYDKTKSFFDKISCESLERSKGKVQRVDWRQERKLNVTTFGVSQNYRRPGYRGRGGYGGGYGPRQNYNSRGGYNRNYGQMGGGGDRRMNSQGGFSETPQW